MTLRLVTPPTTGLVSLDEAKAHLRVFYDDEDAAISLYLKAAQDTCEFHVQRRFLQQIWEWVLDDFRRIMVLPLAPVLAPDKVLSLRHQPRGAGALVTTDPGLYVVAPWHQAMTVRARQTTVWPLLDPDAPEPVVVRFTVGAPAPDDVDPGIRNAVLVQLEYLWSNRGGERKFASNELHPAAQMLLLPHAWLDR